MWRSAWATSLGSLNNRVIPTGVLLECILPENTITLFSFLGLLQLVSSLCKRAAEAYGKAYHADSTVSVANLCEKRSCTRALYAHTQGCFSLMASL
jgi:hypothetical protein